MILIKTLLKQKKFIENILERQRQKEEMEFCKILLSAWGESTNHVLSWANLPNRKKKRFIDKLGTLTVGELREYTEVIK